MKKIMIPVISPDQAIANILTYNRNAVQFADLMPHARAWYAYESKDGWVVAPSKVIGYQNLEPKEYLNRDKETQPIDGRITEKILQSWSELVEQGHPLHDQLWRVLKSLCAQFGKKPNDLARISIIYFNEADQSSQEDEFVSFLADGFNRLTASQKTAFRTLIE